MGKMRKLLVLRTLLFYLDPDLMPFPSSVIARAISNSETLNYYFVKQDIGSVRGSPNVYQLYHLSLAIGIIGIQRTLNIFRQPMVPLMETLVPLIGPVVPMVSPTVSKVVY